MIDKKFEIKSELSDVFKHRKSARILYLENNKRRKISFDTYILNNDTITLKKKGIVLKILPLDSIIGIY